ncbi:MAG: deoxyribonuclease V [Chloroflexota bacterium]|nr:MAG: deoxyribonuclease V [Chloroflexota bacterium]
MKIPQNLNWNLTPKEASTQQSELVQRVRAQDDFGAVNFVAGVDVGFEQKNQIARAAVVVLALPSLEPIASAIARRPVTFPYVPGLLAYRELPVILDAFEKLEREPDLLIMDGHGYAHPRRFGIACHLGVLLDKPTIGCAKSILVGHAEMPENRVGAWTPLMDKGEIIGAALRTKLNAKRVTNPIYVSIGHRISLETAIDFVLRCCKGYRVPETTRYAHLVAGGAVLSFQNSAPRVL